MDTTVALPIMVDIIHPTTPAITEADTDIHTTAADTMAVSHYFLFNLFTLQSIRINYNNLHNFPSLSVLPWLWIRRTLWILLNWLINGLDAYYL